MNIPFTIEEFFNVFEKYNIRVFPFQFIIFLSIFCAIIIIHSKLKNKNKLVTGILAMLWIWIGLMYHIVSFSKINTNIYINKGAYIFGIAFIIQGLLFIIYAVKGSINFSTTCSIKNKIGYFFIVYGLIIYPIISYFIEGSFTKILSVGIPCPSTIVTFGFLLLIDKKIPTILLIIPSLWALIGISAAINLKVYQDFIMVLAAFIVNGIAIYRRMSKYNIRFKYFTL